MGTKVRFLVDSPVDGIDYKANQVVDLPAKTAKSLEKGGVVDSNEAAVKYCVTELKAEVILHKPPQAGTDAAQQSENDPGKQGDSDPLQKPDPNAPAQ